MNKPSFVAAAVFLSATSLAHAGSPAVPRAPQSAIGLPPLAVALPKVDRGWLQYDLHEYPTQMQYWSLGTGFGGVEMGSDFANDVNAPCPSGPCGPTHDVNTWVAAEQKVAQSGPGRAQAYAKTVHAPPLPQLP